LSATASGPRQQHSDHYINHKSNSTNYKSNSHPRHEHGMTRNFTEEPLAARDAFVLFHKKKKKGNCMGLTRR